MTIANETATADVQLAADRVFERSMPWDMVLPYEPALGNDAALMRRWHEAGFAFVSMHPAGDRHGIAEAVLRIGAAKKAIEAEAGRFRFAETVADVKEARAEGKLAVGLHLEGTNPLERNIEMIEIYYRMGIRFCHPVFNLANFFGGGCADRVDGGLTRFGERVVAEMNRVGMLLDGAHCGHRTSLEMVEASSTPIVFSHQGVHALEPHFRNLRDDQIRACAARGGVIGISGANNYLGGTPTAERIFRHVDYVASLVGPEHVGFGLDVIGDSAALDAYVRARPDEWFGCWRPWEFAGPEEIHSVVELMLGRGYDPEAAEAILGGNFMRVCAEVWK